MTAYASNAEFESYAEGWTTDDADALTRLLERASDDVDTVLGFYAVYETGDYAGRKIDLDTDADYTERRALVRATCAQALYRVEMGEDFFTRPTVATSGPEFSLSQPPSHISPQTMRELAGTGLMRNTTSSRARSMPPARLAFERNVD